jgi:hypothetical protein
MISAPTSAKYACAYWSSTPVVPSPEVSSSTRARNVRVAVYASVRRAQSGPNGFSGVWSVVVAKPSREIFRSTRTAIDVLRGA